MRLLQALKRILIWALVAVIGLAAVAAVAGFLVIRALVEPPLDQFGTKQDEAMANKVTADMLRPAADPYFVDMDGGILRPPAAGSAPHPDVLEVAQISGLEPEAVRQAAVRGQNMWLVWTGGNDRFWDWAAANTAGAFDLLKLISSYKTGEDGGSAYGRVNRFRYLGLSNEPCFAQAKGPDPRHFGLWIDQRSAGCPADPFANAAAGTGYPGVPAGARGRPMTDASGKPTKAAMEFPQSTESGALPVGSYYGEPTGILGLRLFPNPDFDAAAQNRWDPERFYSDPDYYNDAKLVRPYRVGMSCAFCHVGPKPIHPPKDVENPEWPDLASNTGAQYFWVDRIFFWNTAPRSNPATPAMNEGNLLFQLFHTNPPGALDTSLVSTDYMNNPRTMNAVYQVLSRLRQALVHGAETLKGDELANRQFQDFPETAALSAFFDPSSGTSFSMRVLKDGADSVGALGALNRVYLNIGLFSEEWLLHFRPFIGGQKISPIRIADAQRNSSYWQATERMTPDMAVFFLVTARTDRLADAPGGSDVLARDPPQDVSRGQEVFAERCAACHSSKQPVPDAASGVDQGICKGGGSGPHYRECWDRYWSWTQTSGYRKAMLDEVRRPDFLDANYLSTERRVPLDLLKVNACSPIATNGLSGDIWDNFTSSDYKSLPPVKPVSVNDPVSGGASELQPLGEGRGYLRPASLVALWSTAPYLQNNSVGYAPDRYGYGKGTGYGYASGLRDAYGARSCPSADGADPGLPCVANRLAAFDSSIRELLDPRLRRVDRGTAEPVPGYIYRTTAPSCLMVPSGYVPDAVRRWTGVLNWLAPWAVKADGSITLGPFPQGFPVNALVNTKLLPDNDEDGWAGHYMKVAAAAPVLLDAFRQLGGQCSPEQLADPAVNRHADAVVKSTGLIDAMVGLSKCPDYVVNRGHEFGAGLSAADQNALIAYLRRM